MKIKIERQNRKTVCLKVIDSENAVLKIPKNYSNKKTEEFLNSKRAWLEKVSNKLNYAEKMEKEFDFVNFVYFNSKPIMRTTDLCLDFKSMTRSEKAVAIRKCYLGLFSELEKQVEAFSLKTGLKYNEIKVTDSARIWGSYNSNGVMKLNYKLVILPSNLVEYVIVHEFCHSKFMNHKPQFWHIVEQFLPDYKERRKELKNYAFVLKKGIF
ncbi:MAG: M48 family metallopeptidase [Candidatus Caccovivens sp.]